MLAVAALRTHGLGPRRESQAAAHHEPEAHGAHTLHRRPPSALRPDRPLGRPSLCLLCIPLGRACVAKKASFGLRWCSVQPFLRPLSPVAGPGLCRPGSRNQIRRRRALSESGVLLVAFLQKTVSSGERRGREERARVGAFCLLWSPESWIPWRGFSPPSGFPHCRRDPFQELLGCGLAAELLPLGPRLRRLPARDPGGLGAQPEWAAWRPRKQRPEGTHVGVERANPAEIRSSHTLPPGGCRRRKRRRRRQDRPRQGEEETLSGSASGQPQPGRQVRKVGIKNSCTGRRAGWGRGWITGRANGDCRQRPFYFRPVRRQLRRRGSAPHFTYSPRCHPARC